MQQRALQQRWPEQVPMMHVPESLIQDGDQSGGRRDVPGEVERGGCQNHFLANNEHCSKERYTNVSLVVLLSLFADPEAPIAEVAVLLGGPHGIEEPRRILRPRCATCGSLWWWW